MTKSDTDLLAEAIKAVTGKDDPELQALCLKSCSTWNNRWPTWLDRTVFYSTLKRS